VRDLTVSSAILVAATFATNAFAQSPGESCGPTFAINGGSCCPFHSGGNTLPSGADNVDFSGGLSACTSGGGGTPPNGDDGTYLLQLDMENDLDCNVTYSGSGGAVVITTVANCATPLNDCIFGEFGTAVNFSTAAGDIPASGGQFFVWLDATDGQTVTLACTGAVPVNLQSFSVD
jgi:hypothetical protein